VTLGLRISGDLVQSAAAQSVVVSLLFGRPVWVT